MAHKRGPEQDAKRSGKACKKPGPKPERLKLPGDWKDALRKTVRAEPVVDEDPEDRERSKGDAD